MKFSVQHLGYKIKSNKHTVKLKYFEMQQLNSAYLLAEVCNVLHDVVCAIVKTL